MPLADDILEGLPLGIWVASAPGGEVVYVNPAFERIMGFAPPLSARAGSYSQAYRCHKASGEPYPERELPFARVLETGQSVQADDLVIHRDDGTRINLRIFASPRLSATGQVEQVVLAVIDSTREVEAKKLLELSEERVELSQRLEALGELAGGVAHDFNNVLATVQVLTSMLRSQEEAPRKLEALSQLEKVVESARRLTRTLVDFSRPSPRERESICLSELVRGVAAMLKPSLEPRVDVRCELEAQGLVLSDRGRLEQVLMNLGVNARDAIEGEGRLTLRTRDGVLSKAEAALRRPLVEGKHVVLEVADTGPGIAPHARARLFEAHFTTKTEGPVRGAGLGLAIVQGIVALHRGFIEVEDNPGGGALFRIYFPVV